MPKESESFQNEEEPKSEMVILEEKSEGSNDESSLERINNAQQRIESESQPGTSDLSFFSVEENGELNDEPSPERVDNSQQTIDSDFQLESSEFEELEVNGFYELHKVVKVPEDASSLFNSLSYLVFGDIIQGPLIRSFIVEHVCNNWTNFKKYAISPEGATKYSTKEEYVSEMSKNTTYGSDCELIAAGIIFPFCFEGYVKGIRYSIFGNSSKPVRRLRSSTEVENHYDAYEPNDEARIIVINPSDSPSTKSLFPGTNKFIKAREKKLKIEENPFATVWLDETNYFEVRENLQSSYLKNCNQILSSNANLDIVKKKRGRPRKYPCNEKLNIIKRPVQRNKKKTKFRKVAQRKSNIKKSIQSSQKAPPVSSSNNLKKNNPILLNKQELVEILKTTKYKTRRIKQLYKDLDSAKLELTGTEEQSTLEVISSLRLEFSGEATIKKKKQRRLPKNIECKNSEEISEKTLEGKGSSSNQDSSTEALTSDIQPQLQEVPKKSVPNVKSDKSRPQEKIKRPIGRPKKRICQLRNFWKLRNESVLSDAAGVEENTANNSNKEQEND